MRIIAGAAKGTRLGPVPPGTRPMSDMAREGLFASLGAAVEGARCLDLFAGTGAVGIEALVPRRRGGGVRRALDQGDRRRSATTSRERMHPGGVEVVRAEVAAWLTGHAAAQGVFDLVFCDPPYDVSGPPLDRVLGRARRGMACPGELDRGIDPRS